MRQTIIGLKRLSMRALTTKDPDELKSIAVKQNSLINELIAEVSVQDIMKGRRPMLLTEILTVS